MKIGEIHVISGFPVTFMAKARIPGNSSENEKINVLHQSAALHETLVFPRPNGGFSALGPPKPENLRISIKFNDISLFYEIMRNFGNFSRILVKNTF